MNEFRYARLLSPCQLNDKVTLKTRMVSGHVPTFFAAGPQTYPDDNVRAHYRRIADNGCASILTSISIFPHLKTQFLAVLQQNAPPGVEITQLPDHTDVAHMCMCNYDCDDPTVQNLLCLLASELHALGTRVMLNYDPFLPAGYSYGGGECLSQQDVGRAVTQLPPCPKELFPAIIQDVVEQCRRWHAWGWDGLTVSLADYLNASTNIRTDEYGGEVENRGRFCVELLTAVRRAMGPDFLIDMVLPAGSRHGATVCARIGYTFDEAVRFARLLEGIVDIWHVRTDNMTDHCACGYNHDEHDQPVLALCRRIRAAGVRMHLSACGSFQDPEVMERALEEGACDLFSISRGFFADPEFYAKLREGRGEDITPCLTCNKCQGTGSAPWLQFCAVNPRFGLNAAESWFDRPPRSLKKVAVVGGGPAGMRTAILAAEKGHRVTLYEKTDYLGGQLAHADHYAFKWPLRRYRLWLVRELGRLGVEVRLGREPTAAELNAAAYEAIFACTGARAMRPQIPGAENPAVWNSHQVWGNEDKFGARVVIVGGSEVSMEAAMDLAQRGREVTVLTRQKLLGHDCALLHYVTMTHVRETDEGWGIISPEWERYDRLRGVTGAHTTHVTPTSVTYIKNGETHTLDCDTVVVGGGVRPNLDDALQYAGLTSEFYLVGDVEGDCGNLQSINRHAFARINQL